MSWWFKLGIRHERIEPGKPEQNGRHERMHRTLKAETASPPRSTIRAQQSAFDAFVEEFNYERPHEALGQRTPAEFYTPSRRSYPSRIGDFEYSADFDVRKVIAGVRIRWMKQLIYVGDQFSGELIGINPAEAENTWNVWLGSQRIGSIDPTHPGGSLIC